MKHILLLYQEMIPSVRLCMFEQLRWLAEKGRLSMKAVPLSRVNGEILTWADAVVLVRGATKMEKLLARQIKKSGKTLVYVLDDDLLHTPAHVSSAEYYFRNDIRDNIRSLMSMADCFVTPSVVLAEKYGGQFPKTILVEEPALRCHRAQKDDGKVRIGFAGSVDRTKEVETILSATLRRILQRYGERVELDLFGVEAKLADTLGCRWFPYMDSYAEYQEKVDDLGWDIGLAPLESSDFGACKHYNKFIEYGSHGIVCVASDLPPYNRVIRNGENGVLCANTEDAWTRALSELIEDTARRKAMSERVFQQMQKDFCLSAVSEDLWRRLEPLLAERAGYKVKAVGVCKGLDFLSRAFHGVLRRIKRLAKTAKRGV